MIINYNKLNFIGAIIGGFVGLIAGVGVPLLIRFSPQNVVYFVMGVMGLAILTLFAQMILMLLSQQMVKKLIAPVFLFCIVLVAFFALIIYQQMAPKNAPYLDTVKQIDPWNYFQYMPYLFPIVMLLVIMPVMIWVLKFSFSTFFSRENILKDGISAQAKIINVLSYGLKVNNEPVFKITMEVQSPSQGNYQITKDFFVPHMDLSLLQPGQMVNVKIDPNNPKNVVFDTWTGNTPA